MYWVVEEQMGIEKLEVVNTDQLFKEFGCEGKRGNMDLFNLNFNYCLEYWHIFKGPSKIIASNSDFRLYGEY